MSREMIEITNGSVRAVTRIVYYSDSVDAYNVDTGGTLTVLPSGAELGQREGAAWPDEEWAAMLQRESVVRECLVLRGDGCRFPDTDEDAASLLRERGFRVATDGFKCDIEDRHDDGDIEIWMKVVLTEAAARRLQQAERSFPPIDV